MYQTLNYLVKQTHKGLTVISLALNGGIALHTAFTKLGGKNFINTQITDFQKTLPKHEIITNITNLHWNKLECAADLAISSIEGFVKSGVAGLLELKFSHDLIGHTTHFGLIYPGLTLFYGDQWADDAKLLTGLIAVAAFETTYWCMNSEQDSHPEISH